MIQYRKIPSKERPVGVKRSSLNSKQRKKLWLAAKRKTSKCKYGKKAYIFKISHQ